MFRKHHYVALLIFLLESCLGYHFSEAFECLQFIIRIPNFHQAQNLLPVSTSQHDSSIYKDEMILNSLLFSSASGIKANCNKPPRFSKTRSLLASPTNPLGFYWVLKRVMWFPGIQSLSIRPGKLDSWIGKSLRESRCYPDQMHWFLRLCAH